MLSRGHDVRDKHSVERVDTGAHKEHGKEAHPLVASSDSNSVSRDDQKRRMDQADCSTVKSVRDKGRDTYADGGEHVDGDAEVIRLEGSVAIISSACGQSEWETSTDSRPFSRVGRKVPKPKRAMDEQNRAQDER